jgi:hypothetical protein
MDEFKKYIRTNIAEMRPVADDELISDCWDNGISISATDIENGSPKIGDMIARNPENHNDKWLVAKEYFEKNFRRMDTEQIKECLEAIKLRSDINPNDPHISVLVKFVEKRINGERWETEKKE